MSSSEEATRPDDLAASRAAADSSAPGRAAGSAERFVQRSPAERDSEGSGAVERPAQQAETTSPRSVEPAPEVLAEASSGAANETSSSTAVAETAPAAVDEPVVADQAVAPPSYRFLALVASVALIADALTKAWAETTLSQRTLESPSIVLIEDVLTFTLAYNTGGAFGMLAGEDGFWRRPFFLLVSIAASVFIVNLYRKVLPHQWALKWGLPLVLGGALGNLADRLTKGKVVDFIDYRAGWVETMNELIHRFNSSWYVTSHWPTFNVADICICIGVGLMAIDMFTSGGESKVPAEREASSAG